MLEHWVARGIGMRICGSFARLTVLVHPPTPLQIEDSIYPTPIFHIFYGKLKFHKKIDLLMENRLYFPLVNSDTFNSMYCVPAIDL